MIRHAFSLHHCFGAEHGAHCPFKCKPGYLPAGPLVCDYGNWKRPLCEPRSCAVPFIANARKIACMTKPRNPATMI